MKKISRRAISVLLIAAAVIFGCVVYVLRYIDDGHSWALAFSSANSGSSGLISDRNGVVIASFGGATFARNTAVSSPTGTPMTMAPAVP